MFAELLPIAHDLCRTSHGAAVIQAALIHSSRVQALTLCRNIVSEPGLLAQMACLRHGCPAVLEVLSLLRGEGSDLETAQLALRDHTEALSASRYGRQLLSAFGSSAVGNPVNVSVNKALGARGC